MSVETLELSIESEELDPGRGTFSLAPEVLALVLHCCSAAGVQLVGTCQQQIKLQLASHTNHTHTLSLNRIYTDLNLLFISYLCRHKVHTRTAPIIGKGERAEWCSSGEFG